jgi:hypothetical protein
MWTTARSRILLGIAVGQKFHRALEVGEEHGHLLAGRP